MLIRPDKLTPFIFDGITVGDYGTVADGVASVATIDVPPHGSHSWSYSSRSDKLYFMLEGKLRFDVDGIAYTAQAGDLLVISKGRLFRYFDPWGCPAQMLLVHLPAFDLAGEHFPPNELRTHEVHLQGARVTLRPMTEAD